MAVKCNGEGCDYVDTTDLDDDVVGPAGDLFLHLTEEHGVSDREARRDVERIVGTSDCWDF